MSSRRLGLSRKRKLKEIDQSTEKEVEKQTIDTTADVSSTVVSDIDTSCSSLKDSDIESTQVSQTKLSDSVDLLLCDNTAGFLESGEIEENVPKPKKRISFKLKQLEGADLLKKEEFEAECRRLHTKDLIEEIEYFQKRIKTKQAEVEELQSVEAYAKRHDVDCLTRKYENWKKSCQLALEKLLESAREQHRMRSSSSDSLTMSDLLGDLQIPQNLVDFDVESDSFAGKYD